MAKQILLMNKISIFYKICSYTLFIFLCVIGISAFASPALAMTSYVVVGYNKNVNSDVHTANYTNLIGGAPSAYGTSALENGPSVVPFAMTLSNFHFYTKDAQASNEGYKIEIGKNTGTGSTFSYTTICTISNPATGSGNTTTACSNTTDTITFAQGEIQALRITPQVGGVTSTSNSTQTPMAWWFQVDEVTPIGESIFGIVGTPANHIDVTGYNQMITAANYAAQESGRWAVMPASGVLRDMCIRVDASPTPSGSLTYDMHVNGADTSTLQVQFTTADTYPAVKCSSGTSAVSTGQTVSFHLTTSGTITTMPNMYSSVGFVGSVSGDFIWNVRTSSPTATTYHPAGFSTTGSTTESSALAYMPGGLYVEGVCSYIQGAAGVGKGWTYSLNKNQSADSPTFSYFIGGATTQNYLSNCANGISTVSTANDTLALKMVPTGAVSASPSAVSYVLNTTNRAFGIVSSSGTNGTAGSGTITITAPTNISNGNLLVAGISASQNNTITPPAGWSVACGSQFGASSIFQKFFYKVANGESGDYVFTDTSASMSGIIYNIVGANTSNPIDVCGTGNTGTGTTATGLSITTTNANDMVLWFNGNSGGNPGSGTPPRAPNGYVPQLVIASSSSVLGFASGYTHYNTAGATGAQTAQTATPWGAIMIGINQATTPGVPTGVSATAGTGQATVSFTAPAANGASITSYTVTSSPGGITASGSASPITVTGLSNGTAYTFTVTATNSIGTGSASSASNSVTPADTTSPTAGNSGTITTASVAGTSLTLNWTKATDDFSAQSALQYRVYKSTSNNIGTVANIEANGTALNSYTADIATLGVTGLTNGTTYYFNLIAKDESGNQVAYTTKSETTLDTAAPTVSVTAPANSATISGTQNLTASASDNVGVVGVQFKVDGSNVGSEDTTPTPYQISWDSTSVADGSHTITAVARDAATNSTTSSSITVTVDNTAPVRSNGSPAVTLDFGTTSTTVSLTTNENATCKYSASSGTAYSSMTVFSTTGTTSHSTTISGLTNGGSYTYYVKCSDGQSNINATDYAISFTVAADTTSPVVSVTAPANNAIVNGASVSLTANATDDVSVSGVQFKLDGSNIGAEDTTSTYGITWDSTSTTDGTHIITAVARDGSSNSSTSAGVTITVDNTAPVRSAGSPSTALSADTTSTIVSLSTNENATCKYSTSSGTAYGSMTAFTTTGTTVHSKSFSVSTGSSYNYYVKCSDIQSNTNATDYTISFSVASDTAAPTVSVTAPSNSATVSGASVSLTANASDNIAVVGVQFKVDGTSVGSEDTTSTYGITWDSTSVSDGSHTITAVARDAATNSTTSSSISVTVDNTAPVRSSGSPSTELSVDTTSTTISLSTNESATCQYSTSAGTAYGSMIAFSTTGGTSHSKSISGLTNGGSYIYYVKCSDGQGNTNATDYTISFSVSASADTTPAPSGSGGLASSIIDIISTIIIPPASTTNTTNTIPNIPAIITTTSTTTPTTINTISSNVTPIVTATYNFGTVTLSQNSAGNSVKELQRFLNDTLNLGLSVDGKLGPKTSAVIKKWQKAHGLKADGIVGPKTKAKMKLETRN